MGKKVNVINMAFFGGSSLNLLVINIAEIIVRFTMFNTAVEVLELETYSFCLKSETEMLLINWGYLMYSNKNNLMDIL